MEGNGGLVSFLSMCSSSPTSAISVGLAFCHVLVKLCYRHSAKSAASSAGGWELQSLAAASSNIVLYHFAGFVSRVPSAFS